MSSPLHAHACFKISTSFLLSFLWCIALWTVLRFIVIYYYQPFPWSLDRVSIKPVAIIVRVSCLWLSSLPHLYKSPLSSLVEVLPLMLQGSGVTYHSRFVQPHHCHLKTFLLEKVYKNLYQPSWHCFLGPYSLTFLF